MLRRSTASLGLLTIALILGVGPAPASAASIVSEMMVNGVDSIVPYGTPGSTLYAYYSLVNTRPTTVNDLVVTVVSPTGSVVPINTTTSPLTLVGGSSGFNTSYLGGFSTPSGTVPQELALDFSNETSFTPPYNNPLAAGGVANFKLSLDPSYAYLTAPTLTIQDPYTDLSLTSYTPAFANAGPNTGGINNTPEPVSLVLWSVMSLGGMGLLRVRAFRRARQLTPTWS